VVTAILGHCGVMVNFSLAMSGEAAAVDAAAAGAAKAGGVEEAAGWKVCLYRASYVNQYSMDVCLYV